LGYLVAVRRGEVYIGFEWSTLKEVEYLADPGVDRKILLR